MDTRKFKGKKQSKYTIPGGDKLGLTAIGPGSDANRLYANDYYGQQEEQY